MDTVKREDFDGLKSAILRDVQLRKEIKNMFKVLLFMVVASMIVLMSVAVIVMRYPTQKELILLNHLETEKRYLDKNREELLLIKKLALERDSIQLVEYKILTDAFRIMVNDEYINNARKNRLK